MLLRMSETDKCTESCAMYGGILEEGQILEQCFCLRILNKIKSEEKQLFYRMTIKSRHNLLMAEATKSILGF